MMCSPAKFYILFMIALVLFDFYQGYAQYAMRHTVYLVFGGFFLFALCAANMDFAAWGLLLIPILFYIFLIALWTFDQSFYGITRTYNTGTTSGNYFPVFINTSETNTSATPSISVTGSSYVPNWDEWKPTKVIAKIHCNTSADGTSACSSNI